MSISCLCLQILLNYDSKNEWEWEFLCTWPFPVTLNLEVLHIVYFQSNTCCTFFKLYYINLKGISCKIVYACTITAKKVHFSYSNIIQYMHFSGGMIGNLATMQMPDFELNAYMYKTYASVRFCLLMTFKVKLQWMKLYWFVSVWVVWVAESNQGKIEK